MKKYIMILVLTSLPLGLLAQGFDLGIKAGANFSTLTDLDGSSPQTGFVIGAFTAVKISDRVGLQVEALYSQQGAKFDFGQFDLDYVNIPILLKFYLGKRIHIDAGPQFGVLIDDNAQSNVGEVINDIATNKSDFSGVVGLGFDLPLGIRLDGRYNFGLSDVPDEPNFKKGKKQCFCSDSGLHIPLKTPILY